MAPRSRQRRITRMDGAVDAMTRMGFSVTLVKRVAKQLLKEYGGDVGWSFIEQDSYGVLIEALLRHVEENDQENNVQDNYNESKNEALAEASGVAKDTEISDNALVDAVGSSSAVKPTYAEGVNIQPGIDAGEENGRCWKDIGLDQNSSRKKCNVGEYDSSRSSLATSPLVIPSPAPITKRHLPCYGWLESNDEDDEDFVYFTMQVESMPRVQRPCLLENISPVTNSRAKRKSRWDVKPHDP